MANMEYVQWLVRKRHVNTGRRWEELQMHLVGNFWAAKGIWKESGREVSGESTGDGAQLCESLGSSKYCSMGAASYYSEIERGCALVS